jgi:hypothetical protein
MEDKKSIESKNVWRKSRESIKKVKRKKKDMQSILNLPTAYKKLTPTARKRFDSIFSFQLNTGKMVVPESMKPWAKKQFGSVAKLEKQPILKVNNKIMFEGALFNKLRADRPMSKGKPPSTKELLDRAKKEPFADVEANTPEDTFGRLYGKSEISASNVAKYDAIHGLIIFNKANPLAFTKEETIDHFNAALSWIAAAQSENPKAKFPVIGWNCLWKAGASLVHGHMQVLVGIEEAYAVQELWRFRSTQYEYQTGKSYWEELFKVHESVGLGKKKKGIKMFASLTPKKEKEVTIISQEADEVLFTTIHKVLESYKGMGVNSFNVAVMLPPKGKKDLDTIVKIVDRGSLESQTTDIGIAELYLQQSVIGSDPVKVWREVKKAL